MSSSRISELAARIQRNTSIVDEYLQSNGFPSPSFDEDGLTNFHFESETARDARNVVIEGSLELRQLLQGPTDNIGSLACEFNGSSLQAITRYSIPSKVPLNGEISFRELAKDCPINELNLTRLLRFAMVRHRLFREPRKGYVAHTVGSRRLVEDNFVNSLAWVASNETWPSHAHTIEALEKWENSNELNETGFNIGLNTADSVYDFFEAHHEYGKHFEIAIGGVKDGVDSYDKSLGQGYAWETIGHNGAGTVVDIGGSIGKASASIARRFPKLKFVVQDLADPIARGEETVPADVGDRIEFMIHDFFKEQPVQADAYYFRFIFHNWADGKVLDILRALVPALRPGAKVVVNDYILPELGTVELARERAARAMDITMLSWFNAREREAEEWENLFRRADSRFTDIRSFIPEEATMGFIEATWQ